MVIVDACGRNLRYRNGSRTVLDSFSLEAKAGELISIEGESGSGKTTILRFLLGDNDVVVDTAFRRDYIIGTETLRADDMKARCFFGYVGIEHPFLNWCSIATSISKTAVFARRQVRKESVEYDDKLKSFGLDLELTGRRPHELSYGQRRRFALYSALLFEPKVLFIDELFSGLDQKSAKNIAENVVGYIKQMNACAIIATHEPSHICSALARRYCISGSDGNVSNLECLQLTAGEVAS